MTCKNLAEVRQHIDALDDQLIQLLAQRQQYVLQAATFKTTTTDVKDDARVEAVIAKVRQKAEHYGADPTIVEKLYREMIAGFIQMELTAFEKNSH